MRRIARSFLAGLLMASWACGAQAGAWMRGEGEGFALAYTTLRQSQATAADAATLPSWDAKLYLEYGVRSWLTLGVDAFETGGSYGQVLGFARLPISRPDARLKLAGEVALGQYHDAEGVWRGMSKLTLSAGHGVNFDWTGQGWWALDAAVENRPTQNDPLYKLDATLGAAPWQRLRPVIKIETAYLPGDPFIWGVTPGVLISGRNGLTWAVGVDYRSVAGLQAGGLRFETWWAF